MERMSLVCRQENWQGFYGYHLADSCLLRRCLRPGLRSFVCPWKKHISRLGYEFAAGSHSLLQQVGEYNPSPRGTDGLNRMSPQFWVCQKY